MKTVNPSDLPINKRQRRKLKYSNSFSHSTDNISYFAIVPLFLFVRNYYVIPFSSATS